MIHLLNFIKYNRSLLHLDLSHTGMTESMITNLGTAMRRSKSMVVLHLSGNPGVTDSVKDYLETRVRCKKKQETK